MYLHPTKHSFTGTPDWWGEQACAPAGVGAEPCRLSQHRTGNLRGEFTLSFGKLGASSSFHSLRHKIGSRFFVDCSHEIIKNLRVYSSRISRIGLRRTLRISGWMLAMRLMAKIEITIAGSSGEPRLNKLNVGAPSTIPKADTATSVSV